MTTTPYFDKPRHPSTSRSHRFALALLSGLALLCVLGAGCEVGRFPICKTNDDCKSEGKNHVCYNLKCAECQYDTDCPSGSACNTSNECKSLGGASQEPDGGLRAWGPGSWDECAKACDNPDCIKGCDQKFQK
jgi:hypothetical protein